MQNRYENGTQLLHFFWLTPLTKVFDGFKHSHPQQTQVCSSVLFLKNNQKLLKHHISYESLKINKKYI